MDLLLLRLFRQKNEVKIRFFHFRVFHEMTKDISITWYYLWEFHQYPAGGGNAPGAGIVVAGDGDDIAGVKVMGEGAESVRGGIPGAPGAAVEPDGAACAFVFAG